MTTTSSDEFRSRIWATAQRLVALRGALTRWAAGTPLSPERQEDLVLATYEALANSAEHAYPEGQGGPLELVVRRDTERLTVVVADEGRWRPPDPRETVRGRGRALIRALADASNTEHRDDGTTVTMHFLLTPT